MATNVADGSTLRAEAPGGGAAMESVFSGWLPYASHSIGRLVGTRRRNHQAVARDGTPLQDALLADVTVCRHTLRVFRSAAVNDDGAN